MDGASPARTPENSSLGRLPSLRAPRDLTLGGNGRGLRDPTRRGAKRTFAPNIPAPKIKKERLESSAEADVPQKSSDGSSRGRDRGGRGQANRGRGQGRGQNVVYQKSIFEEWSNTKPRPREGSGLGFGGGGGGSGGGGRGFAGSRSSSDGALSGVVKVKDEPMEDGSTDATLKFLLRDDFIDDESLSTVDPSMFPVLLDVAVKNQLKLDDTKPTKQVSSEHDIKVKEENKDVIDTPELKTLKPINSVPWTPLTATENSFFTSLNENKKLLFIHFPDVLPGFPSSKSLASSSATTGSSAKTNASATQVVDPGNTSHSLNDFTEGFIGKMKVRRSGKVELELSNVVFEGTALPSRFLQEVVVCEFERNTLQKPVSGDMTVIGQIGHKINFTPKIDGIVDSISQ